MDFIIISSILNKDGSLSAESWFLSDKNKELQDGTYAIQIMPASSMAKKEMRNGRMDTIVVGKEILPNKELIQSENPNRIVEISNGNYKHEIEVANDSIIVSNLDELKILYATIKDKNESSYIETKSKGTR